MKYVSYCRVSTEQQGQSGLGLDAQRTAVENYVCARSGELVASFVEVESGRVRERPELCNALAECKRQKATLVVGKLDRLARDARYFLEILDSSKVHIAFADLPDVSPNTSEGRMLLTMMASVAEFEARRGSERTRAGIRASMARGTKWGTAGAANLRPNIEARQAQADAFAGRLAGLIQGFKLRGLSQRAMVEELNAIGVPAARGGAWKLGQLQRVISRLPA